MTHQVILALGTNICRRVSLSHAYTRLQSIMSITASSPIYESIPQGNTKGPEFFNTVLYGVTELELSEFQKNLKQIEKEMGRCNWQHFFYTEVFSLRCLDIDIIMYDDVVSTEPELPRKDIYKYDFVLKPLAELLPDTKIAGTEQTFKELAQELGMPQKKMTIVPFLGEFK